MQEQIISDLLHGTTGFYTHISPEDATKGLTPEQARIRPVQKYKEPHSCWDLLHHLVKWQEIVIQNLQGVKRDWRNIPFNENWPSPEDLAEDKYFYDLLLRMGENTKKLEKILENSNLMDFLQITGENSKPVSKFRILLVYLQHTSYHIGQIITTRKYLGIWPGD